jgi:hypothetical protein
MDPPNHLARFPLPGADFLVERRGFKLMVIVAWRLQVEGG